MRPAKGAQYPIINYLETWSEAFDLVSFSYKFVYAVKTNSTQ